MINPNNFKRLNSLNRRAKAIRNYLFVGCAVTLVIISIVTRTTGPDEVSPVSDVLTFLFFLTVLLGIVMLYVARKFTFAANKEGKMLSKTLLELFNNQEPTRIKDIENLSEPVAGFLKNKSYWFEENLLHLSEEMINVLKNKALSDDDIRVKMVAIKILNEFATAKYESLRNKSRAFLIQIGSKVENVDLENAVTNLPEVRNEVERLKKENEKKKLQESIIRNCGLNGHSWSKSDSNYHYCGKCHTAESHNIVITSDLYYECTICGHRE